jgi:hypothetical protein
MQANATLVLKKTTRDVPDPQAMAPNSQKTMPSLCSPHKPPIWSKKLTCERRAI